MNPFFWPSYLRDERNSKSELWGWNRAAAEEDMAMDAAQTGP